VEEADESVKVMRRTGRHGGCRCERLSRSKYPQSSLSRIVEVPAIVRDWNVGQRKIKQRSSFGYTILFAYSCPSEGISSSVDDAARQVMDFDRIEGQ
jgi:hypothetical protein